MSDLAQAIQKLTKTDAEIWWGTAKAVDEEAETCTVEVDGLEYEDVLLSINGSGVVPIPEDGSKVLIGLIEGTVNAFVLRIEKIKVWKVRASEGLLFEAQGENLLSILTDFITEVSKIIVVQGTSPNVPALTEIQQRAQKLLKDA